jgi:hypothetical protein
MDGVKERRCLGLVRAGIRWGVTDGRTTHWLPASLWAPAMELDKRMAVMNATAERMENLWREAEQEAWDGVPGVLPRA